MGAGQDGKMQRRVRAWQVGGGAWLFTVSEHMCVKTFLSRNVKLEKGGNTLEEKGMASGGISRWCAELTLSLQRPGGAGAASLAVAHRSRDWGLSQSFLAMGLTEVQLCVTGRVTLSDLVACWCAVFSCFV